jgi:ACS family allantoate permease-like MFS transporter
VCSTANSQEKIYAHARLVKNNTGETAAGTEFKWAQALECFVDPQIYLMIFTLFSSCASGGFSTFSTLILKSFGLNTEQTITYQLPWYAFQFVVSLTKADLQLNTRAPAALDLL